MTILDESFAGTENALALHHADVQLTSSISGVSNSTAAVSPTSGASSRTRAVPRRKPIA
jgi:hypothetical protein